jgi:hypothetical protein
MGKLSCTDRVKNEESRKKQNILLVMKRKKAYWISYILRTNCRLKHVIEGKIEGMT